MKQANPTQEILLVTTTSFAQRELCENDQPQANESAMTPEEKLEKACWNGMLEDYLQNSLMKCSSGETLYLWEIDTGATFLCIRLSKSPGFVNHIHSLNPYLFMPLRINN